VEEKKVIIDVDHVTVRFNLATQKIDNLKEYFIKLVKRQLMFQEFLALKDVSFQVKQGEAWGLIGTNGSGKSTMLKAISGIIKPHKGSITVDGTVARLIELGAGFDDNMTARENIFLNGCILGHSEKFMQEHFDEIVDFAEIHKFLDSPIKNYSSGMRARLGFAVATMVKPDILIVDEVLAVGDYKFRRKCEARMTEMLQAGTTLLFVSHSIEEVRRLCTHAIWIDKGVARMAGEVGPVCDAYMAEQKK
jgi:lipopolysaccharide transport system ATP-binding protein